MGIYGFFKKLALSLYTIGTIAVSPFIGPVATIALLTVPAAYHVAEGINHYTKDRIDYAAFEGVKALGVLFCPYLYLGYQLLTLFLQPVISDINNPNSKYELT